MHILSGLLGLVLFGGSAGAFEPVSENHVTENFDISGGHFRNWTREGIAPPTVKSEPYEMRFVVTGINKHSKWASDIGFFFKNAAADVDGTATAENRKQEFRVRFVWVPEYRALIPRLSVRFDDGEKEMATIAPPVALNEPVTLAIRRRNEDTLMLLINGEDVFVHFSDRLAHLKVHVSGVKGAISMPPE